MSFVFNDLCTITSLSNGDMNNLSSTYREDKIRFSHNLLAVVCHFVHRSVPCSVCKLLHA